MRSILNSMRRWRLRVFGIVASLSAVRNLTLLRRVMQDLQTLNARIRGLLLPTANIELTAQQPVENGIDILSSIEAEIRALNIHCDYLLARAADQPARFSGTLEHLVELQEQAIRNQVVVMNRLLEDAHGRRTLAGLSAIEPLIDVDRGPAKQP